MSVKAFVLNSSFPVLRHMIFLSAMVLNFIISAGTASAQGDLFINPKRIVFENQKRSEEISLANTSTDSARYVISFVQIRMKASGEFEQINQPDSGQYFADKNLRIFPRTVTLGPKETQVVKVQTYQKENLKAGEYRSHLYFRAVPQEKPAGQKLPQADSGQVSINIKAVFGITIPVIIRVGESNTQVSLSNLKLETIKNSAPVLSLQVNRQGNTSTYGDIIVNYLDAAGKATRVAAVKGISVYTPTPLRQVKISLNDFKVAAAGQLQVVYTGTVSGKTITYASALLSL
jgi:P pilus assembly chaperone PapD